MYLKILLLMSFVALSGCVLPPKEAPHPPRLANDSVGLTGAAAEPAADGWWNTFQDPELDRLIRLGLKDSPTLTEAQARVGEAVAQAQSAKAGLLPSANLDASALYQRAPQNYVIPPPLAGHSFWEGQAGATLNWDLDFWGRQADAVHRAQALTQSARFDVDNARLMLAGAITQAYVELYREYALADIAERSEAQRQNIVNITRRRVAAGLDTQLELRQAEGQLPQARVAREQAQAAADLAVHQLAALTGQGADAYALIQRPVLHVEAALPVPTALPINLRARWQASARSACIILCSRAPGDTVPVLSSRCRCSTVAVCARSTVGARRSSMRRSPATTTQSFAPCSRPPIKSRAWTPWSASGSISSKRSMPPKPPTNWPRSVTGPDWRAICPCSTRRRRYSPRASPWWTSRPARPYPE